jgi:hypothetical protein
MAFLAKNIGVVSHIRTKVFGFVTSVEIGCVGKSA